MSTLTSELHNIIGSKATETDYGLAKISESTTVTETGSGLVLSAKEKNPIIDGSLANKLQSLIDSSKKLYSLSYGVAIPSGSDLNSYKEVGNYYCPGNDVVVTLKNCPTTNAFTMKIELATGNGYPCQTLREHGHGFIYYRLAGSREEPYGNWMVIKTEPV